MLHVNDITYRIAGRTLLDHATVALPDGAKAGFVGRNGTGKTTLFRIILGELQAETGSIGLPKNARIGQVAQEAPGTEQSLMSFVLAADLERAALLDEAETATDPHRIAEIHLRLSDIDAHAAEARAGSILSGLGFDADAQQRPCSAFSGGWRMRVALAAVLFSQPDLLLLDEPTNYLDLEGTLWLQNYIARYPHTVLIISHDRDLLNSSVDMIVHLDQAKLTPYRGGYDNFERQRRERQALQLKLKKKQEDERRHMQAFVDRFRSKATKARQAQSRLKALARMEPIAAIVEDQATHFDFPNPQKEANPPILQMWEASVGYEPGKPILRDLNLRIDPDDRIALLGQNGNGKSTFAKLLVDKLSVEAGRLKRFHKLEIAYFAQHQLDELRPAESPYWHVRQLMPDATEAQVRARTARIGLGKDKMDTPAKDLSGGEKARLLLGLATFNGPHLLILDEPTNHLDIDARQALAQALMIFEGAVILISHDRHLIEACADRLWLVEGGTVASYDGDMDDYRRLVLERSGAASSRGQKNGGKRKDNDREAQAERRRQAAARREELAPMRKKLKTMESDLEKLRAHVVRLDQRLADPALFADTPDKGAALAKERADTVKKINDTEEAWLALADELEQAKSEDA